jgi:hypothetical protein
MIAGGSNVSLTWTAPSAAAYTVWLQIPRGSKATNSVYRVYPNGSLIGNTVCSPADVTYPCFEIPVNQAINQNKWIQLSSNTTTQWNFSKTGYIVINTGNLTANELLGIAAIRFKKALSIGQAYQGGIIFYIDATGQHGLIAAPTDQGTAQWFNGSNIDTGATGTTIGTGQTNTTTIINMQGAGNYAAKLCDDLVLNGYSDWYLPSKDEITLMYTNIGLGAAAPLSNIGGFASAYYWGSYEYMTENAWAQYFGSGSQSELYGAPKSSILYVRAIRSF